MAGTDILAGVTVAQEPNYVTDELFDAADEWVHAFNVTWTVSADATADGMQVLCGAGGGSGGGNVTMILADASGNILGTTAEIAWLQDSWVEADFADVSVSLNDEVQLWYALSTGYQYFQTDGASWVGNRDLSGSYATPPDPLNNSASNQGEGIVGIRLMGSIGGGGEPLTASGTPSVEQLTASGVVVKVGEKTVVNGAPTLETFVAAGVVTVGELKTTSGTPALPTTVSSAIVNNFGGSEGFPTLEAVTANGVVIIIDTVSPTVVFGAFGG